MKVTAMRTLSGPVVGLALMLSMLLVPVSPAGAETERRGATIETAATSAEILSHCSDGTLCVWVNAGSGKVGSGTHASFWDANSNWHVLNSPWSDVANEDSHWCNFGTHPTLKGARV